MKQFKAAINRTAHRTPAVPVTQVTPHLAAAVADRHSSRLGPRLVTTMVNVAVSPAKIDPLSGVFAICSTDTDHYRSSAPGCLADVVYVSAVTAFNGRCRFGKTAFHSRIGGVNPVVYRRDPVASGDPTQVGSDGGYSEKVTIRSGNNPSRSAITKWCRQHRARGRVRWRQIVGPAYRDRSVPLFILVVGLPLYAAVQCHTPAALALNVLLVAQLVRKLVGLMVQLVRLTTCVPNGVPAHVGSLGG